MELVEKIRKTASAVFLATEENVARDISDTLKEAADCIVKLEEENAFLTKQGKVEIDTLNSTIQSQAEEIMNCRREVVNGCINIIESVIQDIKETAQKIERNLDSFILVTKSTVWPGFTEEMQNKHFGMRLAFSPEFLTEKNSIQDFKNTNRIILGGDEDDCLVVYKYFYATIPERVETDQTLLLRCEPTVAETVKLYANGMLFTKIMFSNEMYQICQKLGIEYNEVRMLACLDTRIGIGHTSVPGHDGQLGAGGHCFPEDMHNLKAFAKEIGVNEKIFTAVLERNTEVREDKDWEKMKGRAVIDE